MNYIEQLMKDNGIEKNEEFYVIDENGTKIGGLISIIFYFDKNLRLNMKLVESDCRDVFRELMSGKCKIEKIPHKPKSVWDLKNGDNYYYTYSGGCTITTYYNNHDTDKKRIKFGNAFLTEKEALFEVERRKCEAILLKYGTRNMMSLGNIEVGKYYIYYDHDINTLVIQFRNRLNYQGTIYFKSGELAQKAIEEVGEDRLKKYVFNVKE